MTEPIPFLTGPTELARFGSEVTICHLLHHTSGIPGYYQTPELLQAVLARAAVPANADGLAVLAETGERRWEYSNTGYDMLGSLSSGSRARVIRTTCRRESSARWE